MKLIKLLIVVLILFNFNCDNKLKENKLIINIEAVIKKTDSINTYFTNSKSIDFTDKQSFWTKLKGTNKNQKIQIVFPEKTKPMQIRLDFGKNIKQSDIILNRITFSYKNKEFSAKGKEIFYFFREDLNNTIADKINGIIRRKLPNQKNGPSLYPKGEKLHYRLNQLYKQK